MTYTSDLLSQVETGDIILWSGNGAISDFVKVATKSKWTHVGIVIKNPDFLLTKEPLSGIYFYNSNGNYEIDIESQKKIFGVQLNDLNETITHYDGEVYLRRLESSLTHDQRMDKLRAVYNSEFHKPYDWRPLDLIGAYAHHHGWKIADFIVDPRHIDRVFCSALTGYAYTQMGLLDPLTRWSAMYPDDFAKITDLYDGSKLGDLIPLKTDSKQV